MSIAISWASNSSKLLPLGPAPFPGVAVAVAVAVTLGNVYEVAVAVAATDEAALLIRVRVKNPLLPPAVGKPRVPLTGKPPDGKIPLGLGPPVQRDLVLVVEGGMRVVALDERVGNVEGLVHLERVVLVAFTEGEAMLDDAEELSET